MSVMQRVREAIEPAHQAIEQTDFSKSLMDGRISRSAYCQYLAQMWRIHYQLEQTLPACTPTGRYFDSEMIRTPAIERDMCALGSGVESHEPMPTTQSIEEQLQVWGRNAPFALLGCCYILEGSRMGSLMIGRALIKSLQLAVANDDACAPGVEYHLHNAAQTPRRVKQLKHAIDSGNLTDAEEQELTLGAVTFMSMLNELYTQLPVSHNTISSDSASIARCPMHNSTHPTKLKSA